MSDCTSIAWNDAWALWWTDQIVSDCRLWGEWTIRSLGRFGKVLQFLSAATLALEIVGYERLRRSALRWRFAVLRDTAKRRRWLTPLPKQDLRAASVVRGEAQPYRALRRARRHDYAVTLVLSAAWLSVILPCILIVLPPLLLDWPLLAVGLTAGLVSLSVNAAPLPMMLLLTMPPAYLVLHPRLRSLVQSTALVLLITGFALDLLAS